MELTAPLISFNATLAMQWVTVLVLFLILKKFFFEKVHNFVTSRQLAVKDAFDNADAVNRKADEKLDAYNKRIANIESEGREIVKTAKQKADNRANEIIDEAQRKAEALLAKAKEEIEKEKVKAISDMREQIVLLSLLAAEKIMEKDIEATGHEAYIDKIIEEAGTSGWLN